MYFTKQCQQAILVILVLSCINGIIFNLIFRVLKSPIMQVKKKTKKIKNKKITSRKKKLLLHVNDFQVTTFCDGAF